MNYGNKMKFLKNKGYKEFYDCEYISTKNFDIRLSSFQQSNGARRAIVRIKITNKMLFKIDDNLIIGKNTKFE